MVETDSMLKLVRFISNQLETIAEANDAEVEQPSIFHGATKPSISVEWYMERIFQYAKCSPSCYVVSYIYLDRFSKKQRSVPIDSFSVHRLLLAAVLVSAKFMDDVYYNNAFYARVGGITTKEMNLLEVEFLFGIGFQLNVTASTFHRYLSYLHTQMHLQHPPLSSLILKMSHVSVIDDR